MVQLEAHNTGVEINGQTVLAFLDGVSSAFTEKTSGILEGVTTEFGEGVPRLEEIGDECIDSSGEECRYRLMW